MRKSLYVMLPCLPGLLAAPAAAGPIEDWLSHVAQCNGGAKPLRLSVIGFDSPGALPSNAAEAVRFAIQTELGQQPGVQTALGRDEALLRQLQEEVLNRAPQAAIAEQLRKAYLQVSAVVFFKGAKRHENGDRVSFRLLAVLPDKPDCAALSDEIERPMPAGPELKSIDAELAGAVVRMMDLPSPAVTEVTVCPFEDAGQTFSSCAPVLTDLVVKHLEKALSSVSNALTSRKLSIRRGEQSSCAAAGAYAHGRVGADGDDGKRLWMNLDFRRGDTVLATTGRIPVFPQELGCSAQMRTFFEHVRAGARIAEAKLRLQTEKPVFARGDILDVGITAGANLWLYCWIMGNDRTASMALPAKGQEDRAWIGSGKTLHYPGAAFGTKAVILENPADELFGCFGSEQPLRRDLHDNWMKLTGLAPDRTAIEVKLDEVLRLLATMRAQPGIVEAYTRLFVQ